MLASDLPVTRIAVSEAEAAGLRRVIQDTEEILGPIPDVRIARLSDTAVLTRFFSSPDVGRWLYTMPNPINEETIGAFILRHLQEKEEGNGALFVGFDESGEAAMYFDVELWPQWGACKYGGAVKAQRQGRGYGGVASLFSVDWCFTHLGVARICETTAVDNERSIRVLSRMGFRNMGEVDAMRPDGTIRKSYAWELERSAWRSPVLKQRRSAGAIAPDVAQRPEPT